MGAGVTDGMEGEGLPWPSGRRKLRASAARGAEGSTAGPGTKILPAPRCSQEGK